MDHGRRRRSAVERRGLPFGARPLPGRVSRRRSLDDVSLARPKAVEKARPQLPALKRPGAACGAPLFPRLAFVDGCEPRHSS